MDYTTILPILVPTIIIGAGAIATHIFTKYLVPDDVDCTSQYTAHDAKHARHAAPAAEARPTGSPTSRKPMVFGRNPLR
jgi:hypothetical protein